MCAIGTSWTIQDYAWCGASYITLIHKMTKWALRQVLKWTLWMMVNNIQLKSIYNITYHTISLIFSLRICQWVTCTSRSSLAVYYSSITHICIPILPQYDSICKFILSFDILLLLYMMFWLFVYSMYLKMR